MIAAPGRGPALRGLDLGRSHGLVLAVACRGGGGGRSASPSDHQHGVARQQGNSFSLALRWSGQVDSSRGQAPSLKPVDLAQDSDPKIVAVLYEPATPYGAAAQAVGVVEASGDVVIHLDLDRGLARQATGGGIETWSRVTRSDPLRFRHQEIRYKSGAWQAETSEEVAAAVPTGRDGGSWV